MQSTRTQGSNFREAYTKYIFDEKDHNNQSRRCQEETGVKQNWHRNDRVSRMRANFGEVTISLPIERLRDRDLILPDFKQNADFKFCVYDTEIHILLVAGLGCVIYGLIPGKLYICLLYTSPSPRDA